MIFFFSYKSKFKINFFLDEWTDEQMGGGGERGV